MLIEEDNAFAKVQIGASSSSGYRRFGVHDDEDSDADSVEDAAAAKIKKAGGFLADSFQTVDGPSGKGK